MRTFGVRISKSVFFHYRNNAMTIVETIIIASYLYEEKNERSDDTAAGVTFREFIYAHVITYNTYWPTVRSHICYRYVFVIGRV